MADAATAMADEARNKLRRMVQQRLAAVARRENIRPPSDTGTTTRTSSVADGGSSTAHPTADGRVSFSNGKKNPLCFRLKDVKHEDSVIYIKAKSKVFEPSQTTSSNRTRSSDSHHEMFPRRTAGGVLPRYADALPLTMESKLRAIQSKADLGVHPIRPYRAPFRAAGHALMSPEPQRSVTPLSAARERAIEIVRDATAAAAPEVPKKRKHRLSQADVSLLRAKSSCVAVAPPGQYSRERIEQLARPRRAASHAVWEPPRQHIVRSTTVNMGNVARSRSGTPEPRRLGSTPRPSPLRGDSTATANLESSYRSQSAAAVTRSNPNALPSRRSTNETSRVDWRRALHMAAARRGVSLNVIRPHELGFSPLPVTQRSVGDAEPQPPRPPLVPAGRQQQGAVLSSTSPLQQELSPLSDSSSPQHENRRQQRELHPRSTSKVGDAGEKDARGIPQKRSKTLTAVDDGSSDDLSTTASDFRVTVLDDEALDLVVSTQRPPPESRVWPPPRLYPDESKREEHGVVPASVRPVTKPAMPGGGDAVHRHVDPFYNVIRRTVAPLNLPGGTASAVSVVRPDLFQGFADESAPRSTIDKTAGRGLLNSMMCRSPSP